MKIYKTSAELKDHAKGKLNGKYGSAMLTSLLPGLICSMLIFIPVMMITMVFTVIAIVNGSQPNRSLLMAIIFPVSFLSALVLNMFSPGIVLFYLNAACGKRYSVSDIFFGFRWQFKKSLALAAITTIIRIACMAPYCFFYYLMQTDYQLKWVLCMAAAYLLGTAVNIPISLILSQIYYLLLDFPKYSVGQILTLSAQIMKGHKGRLFYLQLSFLPLTLLAGISVIGYLWLLPYMQMTITLFYLDLMNPETAPLA